MADNNPQHAEAINSFKEVCAVDDTTARRFLEYFQWDLESAVQHYFTGGTVDAMENGEIERDDHDLSGEDEHEEHHNFENRINEYVGRVTVGHPSTSDYLRLSESAWNEISISARRRPPPPMSWYEWSVKLLKFPLALIYQTIYDLFNFVWSLFRAPPLAVSNPREDVRSFIEEFENEYKASEHGITFYDGPYEEALTNCRDSLRCMIVYLHNPSHESCWRFITGTLLTVQMKLLIERNNLLLWGASVRSQEGYKVSMALRENTYPFLGLLCMRDTRMVMVLRIEGEFELEPMLYTIQTAIDDNRSYLNVIRREREVREQNNRIRREQESDYERSLAADRARVNERKRVESERRMAELREEEERQRSQAKKEKLDNIRKRLAEELHPESYSPESVRVSVRFPSGEHFERWFQPTDSLELLFNATLAHAKCPSNFTLLSSYPRRPLNCAPEWYREFGTVCDPSSIPTFEEFGFRNSVVVLVQDNDA